MNLIKHFSLMLLIPVVWTGAAMAAPSPQELAELGKSLTPLGAIKAGNAEGTIPAWTGGLCKPVAGYSPKDPSGGWPYIDPFANEKPLYSINAANMDKYADKLTDGTKVMMQRYPDTYRVDVYPTHRTACYPEYVYENTIKGAGKASLVGDAPGVQGVHAQIPFPIPSNGYEAMWNFLLRPNTPYGSVEFSQYVVDNAGNQTVSNSSYTQETRSYWDNATAESDDTTYWQMIATQSEPPAQAGTKQMRWQYVRADKNDPKAWTYVPGQRRVRLAPEFSYDTVSTTSGVLFFDEISGFDGKMDKFDFKLIGRKEIIVPYNSYRRMLMPQKQALGKNHVVPEAQRWELHRVWVVEATLKPGQRHTQKTKKFFLDEDTWAMLSYVAYDHQGKPHRHYEGPTFQEYDKPMFRSAGIYDLYDLNSGNYTTQAVPGVLGNGNLKRSEPWPANAFSPTGLAGRGVR